MGKKYSEKETVETFNSELKSKGWKNFYRASFLTRTGRTIDTGRYYIEVIAEQLLKKIDEYKNGSWNKIEERKSSYKVDHNDKNRVEGSNRLEELTACEIKAQKNFPQIGEIIDYQTPLNATKKGAGKQNYGNIDLLAYDKETNKLRVIEFKREDNKETILRCITEVYTYKRFVDSVREKFLRDFKKPADAQIVPSILLYSSSTILKIFDNSEDVPKIKELIEKLGIEILTIKEVKFQIEKYKEL